MSSPIEVVIGEFEDLVALGLEQLISRDAHLQVVARRVSFESLETVLDGRHAVVLVNYDTLRGADAIEEIHRRHPDVHVVVIATLPSTLESAQLLSAGASACIGKDTQARDVLNAIHLASRGIRIVPAVRTEAEGQLLRPAEPTDLLTAREEEVLELLRSGQTNAQIAQRLYISTETVRTHAQRIYRKLGVSSRREVMRMRTAASAARSSSAH